MRLKIYKNLLTAGIVSMTLPFILCSCQWITAGTSDEEVEDLEKDMRATTRKTVFEEALHDFGAMLRAYNVPQTPIQSKNIGNKTATSDVPQDVYVMISTTISKIGRPVIFVPYDAQYVVAEATTGGSISRLYPKMVIAGGITGFDKDMIEKKRKGSARGGWAGATGGARYSAEGGVSRVTLDLSAMDYHTQAYHPGVLTSNALLVRKFGYTWGVHGYYMGNGAAFDSGYKEKQGIHAGLRTLVELSVIELLGRYFEVPYWRCMKGVSRDNEMVDAMRIRFLDMPLNEQVYKVKNVLFLDGVDDLDFTRPGATPSEERIIQYSMKKKGVSTLWQLYLQVWEKLPLKYAQTRARLARRRALRMQKEQAEQAAKQAAAKRQQAEQARKERIKMVEQYKAVISKADKLYTKGKRKEAVRQYQAARQMFPQERHAAMMLQRIEQEKAREAAREKYYSQLVAKADSALMSAKTRSYKRSDYTAILAMYLQAVKMKGNTPHITAQINEIKQIMSKYNSFVKPGQEVKW